MDLLTRAVTLLGWPGGGRNAPAAGAGDEDIRVLDTDSDSDSGSDREAADGESVSSNDTGVVPSGAAGGLELDSAASQPGPQERAHWEDAEAAFRRSAAEAARVWGVCACPLSAGHDDMA